MGWRNRCAELRNPTPVDVKTESRYALSGNLRRATVRSNAGSSPIPDHTEARMKPNRCSALKRLRA